MSGARLPVAGATGVPAGAFTAEPAGRGARGAAPTRRERSRLAAAARPRPGGSGQADTSIPTALGGPDAVAVLFGPVGRAGPCGPDAIAVPPGPASLAVPSRPVAFGSTADLGDEAARHLMAVGRPVPARFSRTAPGTVGRKPSIAPAPRRPDTGRPVADALAADAGRPGPGGTPVGERRAR